MPQISLGELFTSAIQTMPTSDDVDKKYEKPVGGIPASDLAETYLTQHQDISGKANISDLATVATSGFYNDLLDKPTIPDTSAFATVASIPTKLSQLQNDIQGTIYGFHIDGNESDPAAKVTYLADAVGKTPAHMDFANDKFEYGGWEDAFFMPRPCMLKYDGTVDYYLDPTDYSKKADGTASDVADPTYNGNAMMEWGRDGKKIWYNIIPEGSNNSSASIYIADYQVNENYKAYSFIDKNNNYIDHFYTPCYFGTIVNNGSVDVLRSLSGQVGSNRCKSKAATAERTMAQNNGADWDMEFYCDIVLINLLLVLMGKSTNIQAIFGEGLHTSGSDTVNNSFTSGQHDAKGLFYGTNSGAAATYTNAIKVFGMENWYGFMWRRFLGLAAIDSVIKYKMTANTADGSTDTDYKVSTTGSDYNTYLTGNTMPSASGTYIQKMYFDEKQFAPQTAAGTYQQDYCDGLWTDTGVLFAFRGGGSNAGSLVGAFCLRLYYAASFAAWYIGAAPSCKPHKVTT